MQVVFSKEDVSEIRSFVGKVFSLLSEIPGASNDASFQDHRLRLTNQTVDEIVASADKEVNKEFMRFSVVEDSVIVEAKPEVLKAAFDLVIDQYSIIVEVAIAVYPVVRLLKRLIIGFAEKAEQTVRRFSRPETDEEKAKRLQKEEGLRKAMAAERK